MRTVLPPHARRLRSLNTWSPFGGVLWEVRKPLVGTVLLEEVYHRERVLSDYSLYPLPVHSAGFLLLRSCHDSPVSVDNPLEP